MYELEFIESAALQDLHAAAGPDIVRSLGCERIYTCTGEAVEGDPQHAYGNILKMGFRTEYVRENFAPPRPQGT